MLKKLLDPTLFRFLVVGVVNTLFGTAIMFGCYNILGLSYWVSSGANYFFGSILSFFLNKRFTFRNQETGVGVVLRFTLNILVCWGVAYGLAQPLTGLLLREVTTLQALVDNISMLVGMVLFVGLNYVGQRWFAFGRASSKANHQENGRKS